MPNLRFRNVRDRQCVVSVAQTEEVKLDATQAKITAVSAMRARKSPQVAAEEVVRLKLGTVVNAIARSTNQDTIGGKTDYWYRVNLPNGQTWLALRWSVARLQRE